MRLRITHGNGPWESEFPELTKETEDETEN
jgi:hypothetical protein